MYSAVILTLNEEKALPDCLASLAGCDDIVVLDSGSTDATVSIARAAGARVFTRPFDNFAGQHNFAQSDIAFRHPWVLPPRCGRADDPGPRRRVRSRLGPGRTLVTGSGWPRR